MNFLKRIMFAFSNSTAFKCVNSPAIYLQHKFPLYSTRRPRKDPAEGILPDNPLKEWFPQHYQKTNGKIYDHKPFKVKLVPGKRYAWCLCGHSKNQPFCDGSHNHPNATAKMKIPHKPIFFVVPEEKEYWLCNCKQTEHRPYCDGTHRREDIQSAIRT